jgi:pyridoxine/pyridoxamine 5'-phosphate oxidase
VPRRVRPKFPEEWHVPEDRKLWITWAHADEKLRNERVYWVSTSSSASKPHAAPVWGIWRERGFYFETAPNSAKGRNIRGNPRAVVHVQDGLDTVIVEGAVSRVKDHKILRTLAKEYKRKYDYVPDWSDEATQVVYSIKPQVAHAWRAPGMHKTLVNFLF